MNLELSSEQIEVIVASELQERLEYLEMVYSAIKQGHRYDVFYEGEPSKELVKISDEIEAHRTVLEWYK